MELENKLERRSANKSGIDVFSMNNPKNQCYRVLYQREYYHVAIKQKNKEKQKENITECPCGLSHDDTKEGKQEHRQTKEHKFYKKHQYPKSEWKSKQQDRSKTKLCDCGGNIQIWNFSKHLKTRLHAKRLAKKQEEQQIVTLLKL